MKDLVRAPNRVAMPHLYNHACINLRSEKVSARLRSIANCDKALAGSHAPRSNEERIY